MEFNEQMRMRILELIRHQIPDPNLPVQYNPVLLLLTDMMRRLEALEAEVFPPVPPVPPVDPEEEEEE